MDIQHSLDATAVLTLGKDMTFRDYVQGSFRMRQIGIGQKCEVYIIPEVAQLIERELSCTEMVRTEDNMLEQITAWLVICSMRSERVQSNQLLVQVLATRSLHCNTRLPAQLAAIRRHPLSHNHQHQHLRVPLSSTMLLLPGHL